MDSNRWQKIEELYHSALSQAVSERQGWLSEVCPDDETLRLEVLSLLQSAEKSDSFLEEPALKLGLAVIGSESESLVGHTIGRYKILETLGHGGMGEVYLAFDPRLNRRVALKLLPTQITGNQNRVHRFELEAKAASAISHPNVAHIYEIGAVNGQHYITMEYVQGQTLRSFLKHEQVGERTALRILTEVAIALAAAHRAGVIHRDIKPENIMLRDDGYVKVLDFGLAKLFDIGNSDSERESPSASSLQTGPDLFMGTAHYMSPEQVRRQGVDLRTDLWSLGVVAYELLTRHRPFDGESLTELIVAILEKDLNPTLSESQLSPLHRAFLSKALSKLPAARYQTAEELLQDLRRLEEQTRRVTSPDLLGDEPIRTEPQRPFGAFGSRRTTIDPGRPKTIPQRINTLPDDKRDLTPPSFFGNKWLWLGLSLLVLLIPSLYFVMSRQNSAKLTERKINLRFDRLNLRGNISDTVLSPDGKFVASVVSLDGKDAIHMMEVATLSDLVIVPHSGIGLSGLSFSPDSNYVYYLEKHPEKGVLYRVSKLGGGQRKILDEVNTPVTFNPDGRRMAFVRRNIAEETPDLIVAQLDGTSERTLARRMKSDPAAFLVDMSGAGPAWSPDGKVLACPTMTTDSNSQQMNLEILDAETGAGRRLNIKPWYDISRLRWLADGSGLIMAAKDSIDTPWQLQMLTYPGGEVHPVTKDPNNYSGISGTADSSLFLTLYVEENSNISLLSSELDGKFLQRSVIDRKGITEVVWRSDSELVYTIYDSKNTNLWSQDPEGKSIKQLTFEGNHNYNPAVTLDQRHIVFSSTRVGGPNLWRMDLDGTHAKQLTTGVYEDMPNVTPDGKSVIYRTAKGVRKISIEGGQNLSLIDKTVLHPEVSPDGRLLAYFTPELPDAKAWRLEIFDLTSTSVGKNFAVKEGANPTAGLHWAPGGGALTYVSDANGSQNIWELPMKAAVPKQLTDFHDAEIQSFAWSPDGKRLACVRSTKTIVPVLVRLY
jgi:serine/threonine protein kinase/Tol biopolymer transport system component